MDQIDFSTIYRHTRTGHYQKALACLLNKSRTRVRPPYSGDLNHAWYLAGDIYYKIGHTDRALKAFKRSLANWSMDTQAMMAISNCYSLRSQPRWAVHYLQKAVEIEPRNPKLLYNLGNAYLDCGFYDAAIKAYKKASLRADKEVLRMSMRNAAIALERREQLRLKGP